MLGADIELDSSFHLFICLADLHLCFDVSGKFEYCFFQKPNNRGFA